MRYEQTDGPLYDLGTRLFDLIEHLTGERPDFRSGQWHTARWHGRPFLWCQFVGGSAKSYHPHSVLLRATWSDEFSGWARRSNDVFGGKSTASYSARPGVPEEVSNAERFIRLAVANVQV